MRSLIRLGFWIGLALLFIPVSNRDGTARIDATASLEAISLAREAISDVGAICERRPDFCDRGHKVITSLGVKARDGARIAYEALDERFGEPDHNDKTGSVERKSVSSD